MPDDEVAYWTWTTCAPAARLPLTRTIAWSYTYADVFLLKVAGEPLRPLSFVSKTALLPAAGAELVAVDRDLQQALLH